MKKIGLIILGFCLTGCTGFVERTSMSTPAPVYSEYFTTTGAGFMGTARDGRLTDLYYTLALKLNKKSENDLLLNVCFEDPSVRDSSICADEILPKTDSEIILQSPTVYGLVNHQNYEVMVKIYDVNKTALLGTHRQLIRYYDVRY